MCIDRDAFWPQFTTWLSVFARSGVRIFVPHFHLNPWFVIAWDARNSGTRPVISPTLESSRIQLQPAKARTTIDPAGSKVLLPRFELPPTTVITVLKLCGTSEALRATHSR